MAHDFVARLVLSVITTNIDLFCDLIVLYQSNTNRSCFTFFNHIRDHQDTKMSRYEPKVQFDLCVSFFYNLD